MRNETDYGIIDGNLKVTHYRENEKDFVMIHGDKQGLKSLGEMLIQLSKSEYKKSHWQDEAFHTHIYPNMHLSECSAETIIGRLDRKNGEFPPNFKGKN